MRQQDHAGKKFKTPKRGSSDNLGVHTRAHVHDAPETEE